MMQARPPIVSILGHVDHGKTSLLDKIRKSNLAAKEPGQITQAIGAYQIDWKGKKITFLDTPGHEAFTNLRSRGVKVADVAVLVVAADDGVMPQTKESIKIIKEAKIPLIVAINKIDLPTASINKVKGQLAENGVLIEEYGGKVVVVPISAKTGQGIDQFLEMILLVAEMEELKADPQGNFEGAVIEAKKDRLCGPLATILIKNGTLKTQELIECEGVLGKVKLMEDDKKKKLKEAWPSQPVQILGFSDLPPVGAKVVLGTQLKTENKIEKKKITPNVSQEKKLKIILRADSSGSLEAILGILPPEVEVILREVGDVNESDILLAKTFQAKIFSFNTKISSSVAKLSLQEKVEIENFQVIYDLVDKIEEEVLEMVEPTKDRQVLGKAEIIAEFGIKGDRIAGAKVILGRINKNDKVYLERMNEIVAETTIKSMKEKKQDVLQAELGQEFGVVFNPQVDFKKEDVIVAW